MAFQQAMPAPEFLTGILERVFFFFFRWINLYLHDSTHLGNKIFYYIVELCQWAPVILQVETMPNILYIFRAE